MPNEDSTMTIGDLVEMDSQVQSNIKVVGEIIQLSMGDVRAYGGHEWCFRQFEMIEWRSSEIWQHDLIQMSHRRVDLRSSKCKDFYPSSDSFKYYLQLQVGITN